MQRDGNEFWQVLNLQPGRTYHYKVRAICSWRKLSNPLPAGLRGLTSLRCAQFVVDGEWMYAPDHATARDARGNMSNYIQVDPWEPNVENDVLTVESPRASYGKEMPLDDDQVGTALWLRATQSRRTHGVLLCCGCSTRRNRRRRRLIC